MKAHNAKPKTPSSHVADVIPLIRALWRKQSATERRLTLEIANQLVFGRVSEIEPGVWGWEVRAEAGGVSSAVDGDYTDNEHDAIVSVERRFMTMIRQPKSSGWRIANAKAV